MQAQSEKTFDDVRGVAQYRIPILLLVGALLLSAPLTLDSIVDHHYAVEAVAHPTITWWVRKLIDLVGKVGDACLIAALIGVAVDKGMKLNLIEEVAKAASPKLWLQHVPPTLQDGISDFVKHISFVRPDWTVEYTLKPVDGLPEVLEVTSRIAGTVLNCRGTAVPYTFIGSVDPSSTGESLITRVSMSPEFGSSLFDSTPDNTALQQADGTKLFTHPTTLGPRQRYKTVLETVEFRSNSYTLPLFTSTTVASAIVRIKYPKDLLIVQVYTALDPALPPLETGWGQEWEIKKPILPGQCIVASWLPKKSAGSAAGSSPLAPQARNAVPAGTRLAAPLSAVADEMKEVKQAE